jgi:hypothetical protein
MPKVNASLRDIKTTFDPAPPERYRLKIEEIEYKKQEGRESYNLKLVIQNPGDEDSNGKPVYHNISMHKKDKEPNQAGMADLKRFFEAALGWGDDADWENADTDSLLNEEVMADVYIDTYEKKDKSEGKSNKIKSASIGPI